MKPNLLIVDDEEGILNTLSVMFETEGILADIESNPVRAIERYTEHDYGVLLIDIIMPHINGPQVIRSIKEINPLCNVIVMTAFSNMSYVIECIESGAVDYITKPIVDTDLLVKVVRDAMDRVNRWRQSFGVTVV